LISLAQKIASHIDNQSAQINITQNGTHAAFTNSAPLFLIVSFIAARGPIAFATSFDQCANDSNATANIKGILNKLFINSLSSFKNLFLFFLYFTTNTIYDATQITNHINTALVGFIILCRNSFELKIGFNHFNSK